MKLDVLLEGGTGSGPLKIKKRPNKNLWFQNRNLWLADMRHVRGDTFDLVTSENEEEGDIFATDKEQTTCYGCWRKGDDRGITYVKPRPLLSVVHPKMTLKQMMSAQPRVTGI